MGGELKHRKRLSITLDFELADRVRNLAEHEKTTISHVIETILAKHLDHAEIRSRFTRDPMADELIDRLLSPDNLERAAMLVGDKTLGEDLLAKRDKALKKTSGRKK